MPHKIGDYPLKNDISCSAVLISGVGGQGIITISDIAAKACVYCGYDVKKSEFRGIAQRGGPVRCDIKFGKKIYSPVISLGQADLILSLEKNAALNSLPFLKNNGIFITRYPEYSMGMTETNSFLIGLLAKYIKLPKTIWLQTIKQINKANNTKIDISAFNEGYNDTQR